LRRVGLAVGRRRRLEEVAPPRREQPLFWVVGCCLGVWWGGGERGSTRALRCGKEGRRKRWARAPLWRAAAPPRSPATSRASYLASLIANDAKMTNTATALIFKAA
jgi:hypothetical protein